MKYVLALLLLFLSVLLGRMAFKTMPSVSAGLFGYFAMLGIVTAVIVLTLQFY